MSRRTSYWAHPLEPPAPLREHRNSQLEANAEPRGLVFRRNSELQRASFKKMSELDSTFEGNLPDEDD